MDWFDMKISVAAYSFRHLIKDGWKFEQIADKLKEWGIQFVEINNMFTTPEELPNVVDMFAKKGIKTVLLTVDGNNYFKKKESDRKEQFEWMKKWIDAAHKSGITMIRANMGHHKPTKNFKKPLDKIVPTFRPILEYCEKLGITHTFENHGLISSKVEFQLAVKQQFPTDKMGYLLDTGNYNPKSLIYENIGKLDKSIKIVHAKMYGFDSEGWETTLDFKRIVDELNKIGYDGYYSVEYEGSLPDLEGIEKAINLLKKLT